jgi:hypothetical protein
MPPIKFNVYNQIFNRLMYFTAFLYAKVLKYRPYLTTKLPHDGDKQFTRQKR